MVVAAKRAVMERFAWSETTPGMPVLGRGFIFCWWDGDVAARWPCLSSCPLSSHQLGQVSSLLGHKRHWIWLIFWTSLQYDSSAGGWGNLPGQAGGAGPMRRS